LTCSEIFAARVVMDTLQVEMSDLSRVSSLGYERSWILPEAWDFSLYIRGKDISQICQIAPRLSKNEVAMPEQKSGLRGL
jgi:hypothetical protein